MIEFIGICIGILACWIWDLDKQANKPAAPKPDTRGDSEWHG
jgi:hypothetical protein